MSFNSPTPIVEEVTLRARVKNTADRKNLITCSIYSNGEERAQAELLAIRVPPE